MTVVARKVGVARQWDKLRGRFDAVPVYAFEHPCDHPGCRKRGLFGFDVCLRKKRGGRWFCSAHRLDGEEIDAFTADD